MMADFLIELLAELLVPIFSWLTENANVPKPVRYCIASLPPLALTGFMVYLLLTADAFWQMLVFSAIGLLMLVLWFFLIRKIYRS